MANKKRTVIRKEALLQVLRKEDLSFQRYDNGFSIHRNIIVLWDEDYDARVLDWIDNLREDIRENLLIVEENEGSLNLRWKNSIPPTHSKDASLDEPKGDVWYINSSELIES